MHTDLLIVFIILLLGLILCSYLGSSSMEGFNSSSSSSSTTLYGPNNSTVQINTDENGNVSLVMTNTDGTTNTFTKTNNSTSTYYGSNNETAQLIIDGENKTVVITNSDGTTSVFTMTHNDDSNIQSTSYDNYNHFNGTSYPTIFYGPNGGTARVIKTPNNNSIVITNKNGTTEIYYIDTNNNNANVSIYYGKNGGSAKIITDNNGKQAIEITTPNGSKIFYTGTNAYTYNNEDNTINQYSANTNTTGSDYNTAYTASTISGPYGGQVSTISGPAGNTYATYDSSAYYNSLPNGIPKSQIAPGEEDLYILKSEVVPPVCPKCPEPIIQTNDFDSAKCPPCPPCARCPEPNFECKKVPNYKAFNPEYLPIPVLSDFSSFGM